MVERDGVLVARTDHGAGVSHGRSWRLVLNLPIIGHLQTGCGRPLLPEHRRVTVRAGRGLDQPANHESDQSWKLPDFTTILFNSLFIYIYFLINLDKFSFPIAPQVKTIPCIYRHTVIYS